MENNQISNNNIFLKKFTAIVIVFALILFNIDFSSFSAVKAEESTAKVVFLNTDYDDGKTTTNICYERKNGVKTQKSVINHTYLFKWKLRLTNNETNQEYEADPGNTSRAEVNLPYGTYTVTPETTTLGYKKFDSFTLHVESNGVYWDDSTSHIIKENNCVRFRNTFYEIWIPQRRVTGTIKLTKIVTTQLNSSGYNLSGVTYELYSYNGRASDTGTKVSTDEKNGDNYAYSENGTNDKFVTDEKGIITITNLPWGYYYLKETATPAGYTISNGRSEYNFKASNVCDESDTQKSAVQEITSIDSEAETIVTLTVNDENGNPLPDAKFNVNQNEGTWTDGNVYISDENGKVTVKGLCFGSYKFVLTQAPAGYANNGNQSDVFTFDSNTLTASVSMTLSERLPALAKLKLKSDYGETLAGGKFTLYKADGTKIDEYTTAENGETTVIKLEWGYYYFVENYSPKGYEINSGQISFTVDANNTAESNTKIVNVVNNRKKGSAKLTLVDENNNTIKLSGAKFSLYQNDGTFLGEFFTTDGTFTAENLEWGSYYFEQTTSATTPTGYEVNSDKIRFSINHNNCESVLNLTFKNKQGTSSQITITKNVNDVVDAFGKPAFIYKIKKQDENVSRRAMITISSSKTGSVVVSGLTAGIYEVTEIPVARYTTTNRMQTITLSKSSNETVTFDGTLARYDRYSHCASQVNVVAKAKMLTSLYAELKEPVWTPESDNAVKTFTNDDLTVKAVYDDGSEKVLTLGDGTENTYTLNPSSVLAADTSPVTITATYTENGITVSADVVLQIKINVPDPFTITFDANGGYYSTTNVTTHKVKYTYDKATKSMQPEEDPIIMPTKKAEGNETINASLVGWYKDNECTKNNEVKEEDFATLNADTTLYAKWFDKRAMLNTGTNIQAQLKKLKINNTTTSLTLADINSIKYSQTEPGNDIETVEIQTTDNNLKKTYTLPIKAWCVSTTDEQGNTINDIYWWSEDPHPFMNKTSSNIFKDCSNLSDISGVKNWDCSQVTSLSNTFQKCSSLSDITPLKNWDTGKITTMATLFSECSSLDDISPVYNWNTENVSNMNTVFQKCGKITVNGLKWNITSLTSATSMFESSGITSIENMTLYDNSDENNKDTFSLQNMFYNCTSLETIKNFNFDTHRVSKMTYMFRLCTGLIKLENLTFDISSVTEAKSMFNSCSALQSINNVTFKDTYEQSDSINRDFSNAFNGCTSLNTITKFDFESQNVTNMTSLFNKCVLNDISALKQNGDKIWNVSKVQKMNQMFWGNKNISSFENIKDWDLRSIVNLSKTDSNNGLYQFANGINYNNVLKDFHFTEIPNGLFNSVGTYYTTS